MRCGQKAGCEYLEALLIANRQDTIPGAIASPRHDVTVLAMIESAIRLAESGQDLTMDQMAEALDHIMAGRCSDQQIAGLLTALHAKGECVAEVAGAAAAMRKHMIPIRTRRRGVIDTCGTGGDRLRTFNISTAAALVTAAAGLPVAKHGNRGVTSRSGSADVLAALGVNIEADVACVEGCLDDLGICFCFAPLWHKAMKHVAGVRNRLGIPTIFNVLGPLVNPAGAAYQVLGVGQGRLRRLMAEALMLLGVQRAVVVHGSDGLDEVTLSGPTEVTEVGAGGLRDLVWVPADFGLPCHGLDRMLVDRPEQSAEMIRAVFRGEQGPSRDIVVANAAAALWTAGYSASLAECARRAAESIDSGAVATLLDRLIEYTSQSSQTMLKLKALNPRKSE